MMMQHPSFFLFFCFFFSLLFLSLLLLLFEIHSHTHTYIDVCMYVNRKLFCIIRKTGYREMMANGTPPLKKKTLQSHRVYEEKKNTNKKYKLFYVLCVNKHFI